MCIIYTYIYIYIYIYINKNTSIWFAFFCRCSSSFNWDKVIDDQMIGLCVKVCGGGLEFQGPPGTWSSRVITGTLACSAAIVRISFFSIPSGWPEAHSLSLSLPLSPCLSLSASLSLPASHHMRAALTGRPSPKNKITIFYLSTFILC